MSAKKSIRTTNVSAHIYDGDFDASFECIGVLLCRFALCPVMPPDGDDECSYHDHGACQSRVACIDALRILRIRIADKMKKLEEDMES